MGLDLGARWWHRSKRFGMECAEVTDVNDLMFAWIMGRNASAMNLATRFGDRIRKLPHDAIKDPRFFKNDRIIEAWSICRDDLSVLYLDREPAQVWESNRRIGQVREYPDGGMRGAKERAVLHIVKKRSELLSMVNARGIPRQVLRFPEEFSVDFIRSKLAKLGIVLADEDRAREVWSQTYVLPGKTIPIPSDVGFCPEVLVPRNRPKPRNPSQTHEDRF